MKRRRKRTPSKHVRVGSPGLAKFLGELEARVMERVWDRGGATVREVWEDFVREAEARGEHRPAYTTILTVMQNLEKKGLLEAWHRGRQNFYRPCCEREEFIRQNVEKTVTDLLKDFPDYVLATLLPPEAELSEEEVERFRKLLEERLKRGTSPQ